MKRTRDGECPEHGDNCPYLTPAGTTQEKPLPRLHLDPELLRAVQRRASARIIRKAESDA